MDLSEEQQPPKAEEAGVRRRYSRPTLQLHGSLQALTAGGVVGEPEDFFSASQAGT